MHTLNSLISALRQMADEKKTQTEILGWLYDYVTQYGIKMQYAEYTPVEEDLMSDTQVECLGDTRVELIDGEYVPYNITTSETKTANKFIKFTYLESENKVVYKIILSYIREYNHGPIHQTLVNECNGAVIDSLTWTLLVRPPMIFNQLTQSMTEAVNIGLADENYDLIKIIDGTMVTIYNNEHPLYGRIWCISTANGYDVSFIRWMGPKTYAEIIYGLLLAYPEFVEQTGLTLEHDKLCPGDTRLEFSNLDKTQCYSFIIRTHDFHPYYQDPEGIWMIDAPCTGVKGQIKYTIKDFKIRHSIKGNLTIDKIESLINNDKEINYGYLLQSKKPATVDVIDTCNLNVMVDSNLLKRIRDAIYKYPSSVIRDSLNHNNRTAYFVMKAFLTPVNHTEFLTLFPHFKPMFEVFQILFDSVVNTILQTRQIQLMTDTPNTSNTDQIPLIAVSNALLEYILKSDASFNPINADAKKIIKNYILKSEYAMMFLKLVQ
jgi:hypothetical protein